MTFSKIIENQNKNWGDPNKAISEYKFRLKLNANKKTSKAPYLPNLEQKYNHISRLPLFFKKIPIDNHLNRNQIVTFFV